MRFVAFLILTASLIFANGTQAAAMNGNPDRGEKIYDRCIACHSLDRHRTGPKHCGIIGRPAGGASGYSYSNAMRKAGIIWSPKTLDRFLAAPLNVIPGTQMGYAGIKDPQERADLIAYLEAAQNNPSLCPRRDIIQ